jgi:chemotaxis protein methyltransferase CheR
MTDRDFDIELRLLLDAIFLKFRYDFREYSPASVRRRVRSAMARMGCATVSQLQDRVLHDETGFPSLLDFLTVPVTELFRDPGYFLALRTQVVPLLRTYPSLKLWVAGCSTGEEAYSLAIVLHEEGLLQRSLIYATDINPRSLEQAERGVYGVAQLPAASENHRKAGGTTSLSDYYAAAYDRAVFAGWLRERIVFSDHSLATDTVFAEVQLVSCRNVLIYFDRQLQDRAVGLFREALCRRGFLGIGSKESIRFTEHAAAFTEVSRADRLYQKKDAA